MSTEKTERELQLIDTAIYEMCSIKANAAMKTLREEYDKTYMWCEDCDGDVVKEKDCCNNRDLSNVELVDY